MRIFVIGSINMDLVIQSQKYPKLGETVTGFGFMTNPGGKGANQAVACQKSGASTVMVGAVGDAFGPELIQTLQHYGVDTTHVKSHDSVSSGIAVITIAEQDNAIVIDAGANALVDTHAIDEALLTASPNDYVLLQNEIPTKAIQYALRKAKALGLTTVMNPAPAKPLDDADFKYMDYLILNQTETEFYTNLYPITTKEILEASSILKRKGVKHTLFTLGALGSAYVDESVHWVDAHTVAVVDTTAAGDTYIGGFMARRAEGQSIEASMRYASAAAALTITKKGAQQSIPDQASVTLFMSQSKI